MCDQIFCGSYGRQRLRNLQRVMPFQRVHDGRPHGAAVECSAQQRQRHYMVDRFLPYAHEKNTNDAARSS